MRSAARTFGGVHILIIVQQKHLAVFGLERHHLAQNAVVLLGKIAGGGRQILKRNASVRMAQPRGAQVDPGQVLTAMETSHVLAYLRFAQVCRRL